MDARCRAVAENLHPFRSDLRLRDHAIGLGCGVRPRPGLPFSGRLFCSPCSSQVPSLSSVFRQTGPLHPLQETSPFLVCAISLRWCSRQLYPHWQILRDQRFLSGPRSAPPVPVGWLGADPTYPLPRPQDETRGSHPGEQASDSPETRRLAWQSPIDEWPPESPLSFH